MAINKEIERKARKTRKIVERNSEEEKDIYIYREREKKKGIKKIDIEIDREEIYIYL